MIRKPCSPDRKGVIRKPWLRRVCLLKRLTPLKGRQPLHPRTMENWPDPTHQRLQKENMSQVNPVPFEYSVLYCVTVMRKVNTAGLAGPLPVLLGSSERFFTSTSQMRDQNDAQECLSERPCVHRDQHGCASAEACIHVEKWECVCVY